MTGTVWDSIGEIPDDRSLREAIRQKVEAAGTSFYWAMRLLPSERRHGMYAVYAFCREVDDIADDVAPPAQKQAALAEWHDEIDALYAGQPRHFVACALREPVERYRLRRQDFHAVIDGMEMDAAEDIRAPELATLDLYCGRVAGAVGHLSVHVFGDASAGAHAVADSLGYEMAWSDVQIQHTGYLDPAVEQRKLNRDVRLLRMDYAVDPDNTSTLVHRDRLTF